jgi:hypothetical protein
MPADWSTLTPAETRAWSIEISAHTSAGESRLGRWRRRRRGISVVDASPEPTPSPSVLHLDPDLEEVIDLTDAHEAARAGGEHA